jgi:glycosyltransferase involved in cell wall biosynthesis
VRYGRDDGYRRAELRIVYIVTRMHPVGGAQVHIRDVSTALQAQGHFCTVITSGEGPILDQLRARQVPVVSLKYLSRSIHPVRDPLALQEIRSAVRELRPDLVSIHMAKAGVLGRLAVQPLAIPVVFTAHSWAFTTGIPPLQAALYRRIEKSLGHLARKIITVSNFDRDLALQAGIAAEDRLITVHNGMPDVQPGLRADPARMPPRLVMVARMDAQKDHPTLLRALAGLQEYPWELDLVGDGPSKSRVELLAAELGIGGRVHFKGQRMDVAEILAGAQCSLLISKWEGFPRAILEAMRAGLPVVATSAGGSDEAVSDGETGYIVPCGAVEVLRDRIRRLVTAPDLRVRMGLAGRSRYEQHFTLELMLTRTLAVYREVLGRNFEEVS